MIDRYRITKTALTLTLASLLFLAIPFMLAMVGQPTVLNADGPDTASKVSARQESCESCHTGPASDFALSSKAAFMSCTDCHGAEHTGPDTGDPGVVTPMTCQKCHADQVSQFNDGKHYYGWEAMEVVPVFGSMPSAVTEKGCVTCHRIGAIWDDGSRGRCDLCHSRHLFSAEEAKKPEACGTCHTGDHPHYEMWANSKHGMLYAMGNTERAPTCVTCHDSHKVITAWGFLGLRPGDEDDPEWAEARAKVKQTLETMGPARAPEVMRSTFEEWQSLREEMVARCTQCHAESWARRDLEKGDALLREADLAQAKVIDLANKLFGDGLIDEQTRFGIYRESSSHRFSTYMGGFHTSANYAWDHGYLELVQGIVAERDKAIKTKKISILMPLSIAAVAIAVVSVLLLLWFWFMYKKTQARGRMQ
jgi:hypothetical protein